MRAKFLPRPGRGDRFGSRVRSVETHRRDPYVSIQVWGQGEKDSVIVRMTDQRINTPYALGGIVLVRESVRRVTMGLT